MQIWAEPEKAALPICNYSQILYQFLTFTQNLKRSRPGFWVHINHRHRGYFFYFHSYIISLMDKM